MTTQTKKQLAAAGIMFGVTLLSSIASIYLWEKYIKAKAIKPTV